MKNAEAIRKRLDDVKNMKSYTEALAVLADIQYEIGMEACREREALRTEIKELRKIILGNGDPQHSLLNRMKVFEEQFVKTAENVEKIKVAIIGGLEGEKGLCEKVNELAKTQALHSKVWWAIAAVVIGQLAAAVLRAIGIL